MFWWFSVRKLVYEFHFGNDTSTPMSMTMSDNYVLVSAQFSFFILFIFHCGTGNVQFDTLVHSTHDRHIHTLVRVSLSRCDTVENDTNQIVFGHGHVMAQHSTPWHDMASHHALLCTKFHLNNLIDSLRIGLALECLNWLFLFSISSPLEQSMNWMFRNWKTNWHLFENRTKHIEMVFSDTTNQLIYWRK